MRDGSVSNSCRRDRRHRSYGSNNDAFGSFAQRLENIRRNEKRGETETYNIAEKIQLDSKRGEDDKQCEVNSSKCHGSGNKP